MNAPPTHRRSTSAADSRVLACRDRFAARALLVALWTLTTSFGTGLIGSPNAFAQSGGDDPFAGIEEMVVVGTAASGLFQNQEVSAIAFDEDYLEAIGASDISDVAQFTPNLEIRTPFAASNPTLFIRGVGIRDFNANSSSSVAVYNDDIYMNSPAGQLAQLFDVQSIDVLRGPQTTTYARNANAGTIRVVARKPTGTPGMSASVNYGRFNQLEFEAAVENVIVPDRLTMRTAARWNQRQGFTKNRCADISYQQDYPAPGASFDGRTAEGRQNALIRDVKDQCQAPAQSNPVVGGIELDVSPPGNGWPRAGEGVPPVKEWVNDTRNWAARTIIRFQHEFLDMDWQLNIHGGQNRGDARQFQLVAAGQTQLENEPRPAVGNTDVDSYTDADNRFGLQNRRQRGVIFSPFQGNPFEGDYNRVEKEKIDLYGSNITGQMVFGDFSLKVVTGYEWNKRSTVINLDGNPYVSLEPFLSNNAYQITNEVRLDYDGGEGIAWQLGGMFLYEGLEVDNNFALALVLPRTRQQYTFFTRYTAFWGKFEWDPAETFKLQAGARFNYEDKELNLRTQRFNVQQGTGVLEPIGIERAVSSAGNAFGWAGDVIATYSPLADVNFYTRYARGWKGPHINGGVLNPGQEESADAAGLVTPVEPEILDSIELGMKAEFWGNRIRANWAFFYYDYQNIQVFQLKNIGGGVPVQELINSEDADVLGFEAEIDVKPFEGWAHPLMEGLWFRLTFAWLDSKYTDFVNTFSVQNPSDGNNPPTFSTVVEDFTGNQLVNSPELSFIGFVTWPFGGEWGKVVPRFDWSFKDKVFFNASNTDFAKQKPLWLLNTRLTYISPSDTFEVSAWMENITDQRYTLDVFNLARLRGAILHAIGDPRTYGVTFRVNF
ncbi:MAG: TonB-dependent receptor [Myxococcota bacterium]